PAARRGYRRVDGRLGGPEGERPVRRGTSSDGTSTRTLPTAAYLALISRSTGVTRLEALPRDPLRPVPEAVPRLPIAAHSVHVQPIRAPRRRRRCDAQLQLAAERFPLVPVRAIP